MKGDREAGQVIATERSDDIGTTAHATLSDGLQSP